MSLHVSSPSSISPSQRPTAASPTTTEAVAIIQPSPKLELSGSDTGVVIELILEEICLCCGGAGFVPVTLSETCSSCSASGYELIEDEKQACPVCEGTCWVPLDQIEQCERCDGTGLELTPAGRRLLHRSAHGLWVFLNRGREWRGEV